jgi:hypothetical protein
MTLKTLLKTSGMASLAASIAVLTMPVAASAADDAQRGWNGDRSGQRAAPIENRGDRRAARVDNRSEQRATRIEQRGDRRAEQVQRRTENASPRVEQWGDRRSAQIDRRSERRADRVEERGDRRADRIDIRSERRAERVEDRSTWRNRSYTDTNRNRTYSGDRNYAYRDRDTDRSKSDWNRYNSKKDYRWDRHDWRRDNRYDWRSYRDKHRHIYRVGRYYSPYSSWSYRRLSVGFYLDSLFYSNRYWIGDPYYYRLPPAYGPYRWVRYYDDALLVDIYSGEVVDVIYDVFW